MRARIGIAPESVPRLPRGVELRFDATRQAWVMLAPERVVLPDATAVEVLRCCDGAAPVARIAARLAAQHGAALETVQADVIELLQDLADRGFIEA